MTLYYFLKVKDSNRDRFGRLMVTISQAVTKQILRLSTREVAYWLSIGIFTFEHGIFKGQVKGHAYSTMTIS